MSLLTRINYPGNLLQLANIAERLLIMSDGQPVTFELAQIASDSILVEPDQPIVSANIHDEINANFIREALVACGGKRVLAAQRLGISTTTLRRKTKKYNLDTVLK